MPQNQAVISDVHNREMLYARLKRCTNLPSPPPVGMRIVELGQDPETTFHQVAEVVGLDPALTAKILRMANSPLYARQRKTENLRQAITLFGLNGTLTLALSFSIIGATPGTKTSGLNHELFWRRSLAVASCCQILGKHLDIAAKEELFLIGLLQDIGMLALDAAIPGLYQDASELQPNHHRLQAMEREKLDTDHAEIGAWLLQQWNFPEHLQFLIKASHDPGGADLPEDRQAMARVVAAASELADFCLDTGYAERIPEAAERIRAYLDLSNETLAVILETLFNEVTEMAQLFDMNFEDPMLLESIVDQAREILMLRNLQTMQKASELEETTKSLESRTRELEEENRRDNLTGLYNRAYLDCMLEQEYISAKTHAWPLALAFIDLDHFKTINDNYGHQAGDEVLKRAARILMDNARSSDIVTRYGGEEFVILLPGTGAEGASLLCNRILQAFREARHPVEESNDIQVTASLGIAIHGEEKHFESPADLVRAADRAVYAAKLAGRDQCIFYNPDIGGV